jgi:predicted dehydrogenase
LENENKMRFFLGLLLCASLAFGQAQRAVLSGDEKPLRVAIAGLAHGHVDGFFRALQKRKDVEIVGVFDPDPSLHKKYADRYGFAGTLFFASLGAMLDAVKPDAVATFTNTFDHPVVVEACSARKIPVMMEKPLAVSMEHASAIQKAAARSGIPVIVNYETTWYRSHAEMHNLIKDQKAMGDIRKMVAMDGHQGPQEIHVGPEFFAWLSDPLKNGAGALFDFGCYGANLMTWMMDNQRPLRVTAMTQQIKPEIYARVDDEATVLVEYPKAQGIIQGSWNWPFARKDFEVYAQRGYADAIGGNSLKVRLPGQQEESRTPPEIAPDERDSVSYLIAVVRGRRKPAGLSSLENNMIVTEILTAARESARSGKTVALPKN